VTDINGLAMEKSVVIFDSVSLKFQNSFVFVKCKCAQIWFDANLGKDWIHG